MGLSVSSFVSYNGCLIVYSVVAVFMCCSSVVFDYFVLNCMICVSMCVVVVSLPGFLVGFKSVCILCI